MKKSKRFFLPADDFSTNMLPTDHEPTLAEMGIYIDWNAYHAAIEKMISLKQKRSGQSKMRKIFPVNLLNIK